MTKGTVNRYEVTIVKTTDKAYLLRAAGKEQWLPMSTTNLTSVEGNRATWETEDWKYNSKFGPNAVVKKASDSYGSTTTSPTNSSTAGVTAIKQLLQEALNRLNILA